MLRTRAPSVSLSLPGPDNFEAQLQRLQAERAATERAYLAQLAAYDAALQRLLAQQQQQQLQQRQRQQRPKPSYIARLPPELLSEIACHVSGASILPLLLVCKHWKSTLESTPSLWASLSLPAQPTAASLRALRRHLELAKAAPLAVKVHAALCAPQHLQSYWAGMALLRGALARVRSLEIGVKDRAQLADVLAHLSSAPAPTLRALVLHGPHGEPLHPAHVPPDVLRGAPLERMVLDHACVPADQLIRPGMPLRELDVITVFHDAVGEGAAFADAVERVAPTLERLRVVGSQWRADPAPRASMLGLPAIEAPVLRELSLDNAPLQGLVARLSAPALRVVSLRAVVGLLDVSLLFAAAAALEELSLLDVCLQLPTSTAQLHLPRLATLTLKIDNAAPFLSSLVLSSLHTADIRQPDGASEDAASLLAAVDAFLQHAPGLQSLTLRAQHQSAKDAPYTLTAPCLSLQHLHLLDSDTNSLRFTSILPSVHDLKLTGGSPSAPSLIAALPNIKRLAVHGVDADSVNAFLLSIRAGAWGKLEDVEFEHCPMMDGAALVAAVGRGRLRDVQLWSCGGVSSAQREEIRRLLMR